MDLAASKALADRLLAKVTTMGRITVKSDVLGVADRSANVRVRIIDRTAKDEAPTACNAILGATPFPIEGGELTLKGVTYDIKAVEQKGTGAEHIVQKAVLHER